MLTSQRCAFTSSGAKSADSPLRTTLAGSAATVFAAGTVAWYLHLYGGDALAMTPQEEGLHPVQYPWEHQKYYKTFDHQA